MSSNQNICVLELQLPVCDKQFGVTCNGTGDPCYNTFNTCKDTCSYGCSVKSIYISSCMLPDAYGLVYELGLSLNSIQRRGTKISSKGISERAYTVVDVIDKSHNDFGIDPYWPRAGSSPKADEMPGSFWSRLIARQCWFKGIKAILHSGNAGIAFENYDREIMYVEKLTGTPGRKNGKIRITLQDPLMLLDSAKCPQESDFIAATSVENFTVSAPFKLGGNLDGEPDPDDDQDTSDPNALVGQTLLSRNYRSGEAEQDARILSIKHLLIGSELLEVQPVFNPANPAGWNFTLISRAACGTELSEHEIGATITPAATFSDSHLVDVLRALLDCAGIEKIAQSCCGSDQCIIGDYSFEQYRCNHPMQIICGDVLISKPEDVSKLIDQLNDVFSFDLYFNSVSGRVEIQSSLCPDLDGQFKTINGRNLKNVSSSELLPALSRLLMYHSPIDWSKSFNAENMDGYIVSTSEDSLREPCDRRTSRVLETETIETPWINQCNEFLGTVAGYRILRHREKPISEVSFVAPQFEMSGLTVGDHAYLDHESVPSIDGGISPYLWKLTSMTPQKDGCIKSTMESTRYTGAIQTCITCPDVLISETLDDCMNDDCLELC